MKVRNILSKYGKRYFFGLNEKSSSSLPQQSDRLQFSKENLRDFGELPTGEIPDALKVSPKFDSFKLENNVKVGVEQYQGDSCCVSLFVKAGSRYETLQSSGSARIMINLMTKGTSKMTKKELDQNLLNLGAELEITFERELIGLSLRVDKTKVDESIKLLQEMMTDFYLNENQIQIEKELALNQTKSVSRDQYKFTMEGLFYTTFREHMIGQPMNGNRDTLMNLTAQDIQDHKDRCYSGQNFTLVVTGDVNTQQVFDSAQKYLSQIPVYSKGQLTDQLQTPYITPSMMAQRDDELDNLNIGVSYLAPSLSSPEFIISLVWREILGDYNASENGFAHLNTPNRQYNKLHAQVGEKPGVNLIKTKYFGFTDVGLFTAWIHTHEIWSKDMLHQIPYMLGNLSKNLNQVEVFRARAKMFNKLLEIVTDKKTNEHIAQDLITKDRRISRTEMAYRISKASETKLLCDFGKRWFFDKDTCLHTYGNAHRIYGADVYGLRHMYATRGDPHVMTWQSIFDLLFYFNYQSILLLLSVSYLSDFSGFFYSKYLAKCSSGSSGLFYAKSYRPSNNKGITVLSKQALVDKDQILESIIYYNETKQRRRNTRING